MAQLAAERLGESIVHEISITNVDKPPLDFTTMRERAEQFEVDETMWFTRAPTFAEKAAIFPGATFVVGADTIARIAEARYYNNDRAKRDAAIASIIGRGCRFLVFGRTTGGGFANLRELNLPEPLMAACDEVPEASFREDVSSTELRREATREGADQ